LLKFQSARNATKSMPLRPSRLPDSDGIFTLSNGLRMEKISRSVRQAKQAKILMLTVQSVQSIRSDMEGSYRPYDDVLGGEVVGIDWLTVVESGDDTCLVDGKWYEDTWPNLWAPRVTRWLAKWLYVKFMGVRGVRPPDLPHSIAPSHDRPTIGPRVIACYIYIYIYVCVCFKCI
jgi:hypothetical protein